MTNSVIGRLMEEVASEGRRIRTSRRGGRRRVLEDALAAEVLQALDLLPRAAFLGRVIADAEGADAARVTVVAEVEDVSLTFLPDEITLAPDGVEVQPDALLVGPRTMTLIEAKGPKPSASFGRRQLSREYRATLQQAGERLPLMLVVVTDAVRVPVWGRPGAHELADSLIWELHELRPDAVGGPEGVQRLADRVGDVLAWTTWDRIAAAVTEVLEGFTASDPSVQASVGRQAQTLLGAVAALAAGGRSARP